MIRYVILLIFGIFLTAAPLSAADSLPEDLTELSLEALMNIEVTTVSRKVEKIADAAAAVFVITQEDIHRSSATTIPDLLRMVPGLQVAQIDANKWAISSRGFNGRFANKLLVLMDGRSVYSPFFSGVLWDSQDTVLEDIERIEIIRGPGATLWGANAVNGVINIITKTSNETQGNLVAGGAGSEEKLFGTVRYGGAASDQTHYRIFAKYFDRDGNVDANGDDCADQWYQWRSGFRLDHQTDQKELITFQGDIYQGQSSETATFPIPDDQFPFYVARTEDHNNDLFGGNLLGRWSQNISKTSDLSFQAYYDHSIYNTTTIDSAVNTFDFDFQHKFQPWSGQSIIWGWGYRYIYDDFNGTYSTTLDPKSLEYDLISAFIQDDITLVPERWRLTIGSKFEHKDSSGAEWQPSARVLWTPDSHQSLWGAVSRAVRTPSRGETANKVKMIIPEIYPFLLETVGNPDFDSEEAIAYEIGYRLQPTTALSFDITTFYTNYKKLRLSEYQEATITAPTETPIIRTTVENNMEGTSYGFEAAVDWRILPWWRLQLAYNYLEVDLKSAAAEYENYIKIEEGSAPKHQSSLRSFMDLSESWQLDLWLRYIGELPAVDIDSYFEMDARLSWKVRSDIEVTLVGQNLLDSHHPEYVAEYIDTESTEVQRSVYSKITFKF